MSLNVNKIVPEVSPPHASTTSPPQIQPAHTLDRAKVSAYAMRMTSCHCCSY